MTPTSGHNEFLGDPVATVQAILDHAADGIMTADERGNIQTFNPAASRIFGYQPGEIIGQNIRKIIPRPYLREHDSYRAQTPAEDNSVISLGREVTGLHKDGHRFPLDLSVSRFTSGSRNLYTAIVRDITDRKRAEEELSQSRQLLRQLAAHLQTMREQERTRIAREIHDELGQALTGVKMDISWLLSRLDDRPQLTRRAQALSELVDSTIRTVRKIASDLRPGILDNLGLIPAVEWQASDFQSRTGITCQCTASVPEDKLSPNLKTNLFRIFQETLTNVMRHANASSVNVTLQMHNNQILLEVKDDGRGITNQERTGSRSLGLLGMQERVLLLGGEFNISGVENHGTTVRVLIPA